jgi:hypothetical protein
MTYFAGNCDFPGSIKSFDEMSFAEGLPIPGSDIRYVTRIPKSSNLGRDMKKEDRKNPKGKWKVQGCRKINKKETELKAKIASSEK